MEAVVLTHREYGKCTVRTQNELERNVTPLMLMAKRRFQHENAEDPPDNLAGLMSNGAGLDLVDNHNNNALMLACGNSHAVFVRFLLGKLGSCCRSGTELPLEREEYGRLRLQTFGSWLGQR